VRRHVTFLLLLCILEVQWAFHTIKSWPSWYIVWSFRRAVFWSGIKQ